MEEKLRQFDRVNRAKINFNSRFSKTIIYVRVLKELGHKASGVPLKTRIRSLVSLEMRESIEKKVAKYWTLMTGTNQSQGCQLEKLIKQNDNLCL